MQQPDLNRLAMFAAVVECGGFTAAAERLGMAKSQVSQQVAKLEAELGVALFVRTTRRVVTTESGEMLYADSAPLLVGLSNAIERMSGDGQLEGRLRVTAGLAYSDGVLGRVLAHFAACNPRLELELIASDTSLDLLADGIDLAIRGGFLRDSSLRAVKLGGFEQVAVAAPDLLKRLGALQKPSDLNGQPWIALSVLSSPLTWTFSQAGAEAQTIRARAAMRVNSATVARECARAGVGCTVLPDYMLDADLAQGGLVQLLPDWHLPRAGIHAVYPSAPYFPVKVRKLIEFLQLYLHPEAKTN
ncbi:LysR family transcriptional regulator [Chitinimonas sp. BJB300]|uniref:LysR family transcriptional regulator n=1 Tax=Chitinimonas sp. BJB300 TaxID=1559339 RepID=UPI000C0FD13F|nr:LysR family transcriptional regulator [Chitinimonas sp. BJB300]PHV12162.1 transcriptional regulator [Chitinimonas sp. BJB300]TSJ90106.1 LysR family transcriptional regulator [Chitinimonas sp. BJB300]